MKIVTAGYDTYLVVDGEEVVADFSTEAEAQSYIDRGGLPVKATGTVRRKVVRG